jgi:hypothetical protein
MEMVIRSKAKEAYFVKHTTPLRQTKKRCYKNISVIPKSLTRTKDEHDGKCKE